MGPPIFFQPAPPQPASNARITWPPVLVGGREASQKGLGERRPQKLTLRSDMDYLPTAFSGDGDGTSLTPRQISQIATASIPSQPIARTALAIWMSWSGKAPRVARALRGLAGDRSMLRGRARAINSLRAANRATRQCRGRRPCLRRRRPRLLC